MLVFLDLNGIFTFIFQILVKTQVPGAKYRTKYLETQFQALLLIKLSVNLSDNLISPVISNLVLQNQPLMHDPSFFISHNQYDCIN
jgi:hypothetical protein